MHEIAAHTRALAKDLVRLFGPVRPPVKRVKLDVRHAEADGKEQRRRLREDAEFLELLWEHCCEGMYGAPEYGGNRGLVGWNYIDYLGDVQPRGYSDEEVSQP